MSGGFRLGVREHRPGEAPPVCWDCIMCGVGEPCFCASPSRVVASCKALDIVQMGLGVFCSLPAGHKGDHEAWALPEGGTFDARAELLSKWSDS